MIITVPVEYVKNYFAGTVRNIRVIFIKKAKKVIDRDKTCLWYQTIKHGANSIKRSGHRSLAVVT
jgi:hypothetical protein